LRTFVPVVDALLVVDCDNGVSYVREHLRLKLQTCDRLFTFRNIHGDTNDTYRVAPLVVNGRVGDHRRESGAILALDRDFPGPASSLLSPERISSAS
jgi:hypothetical protein